MPTPTPLPLPVDLPDGAPLPTYWTIPEVAGPGTAQRDLFVALPPGYDAAPERRYPVVYLADGQNCFDPTTAFAGHWELLETLSAAGTRHPAILVGVPNLGLDRLREYSPFDDPIHGAGEAVDHLRYLIRTVKPLIDVSFRTRPGRERTILAGSSMGGLLALYGLVAEAATFGHAWVMSPAFWYADAAIFDWLAEQPAPVGSLWLDVGALEGEDELHEVRLMRELLLRRGWRRDTSLHYHEDPLGDHSEASWARRVREHWNVLIGMAE